MTASQFKSAWRTTEQPLAVISPDRLTSFHLLPDTRAFLTETGLPIYASPFLSFSFIEHRQFPIIGTCREADLIIINQEEIQQVTQQGALFFNSSIQALADFLIIYRNFEDEIEVYNSDFTDAQFETLQQQMRQADEKALITNGFWKQALETLLADRQDFLNSR
jgi:hypothetical protein